MEGEVVFTSKQSISRPLKFGQNKRTLGLYPEFPNPETLNPETQNPEKTPIQKPQNQKPKPENSLQRAGMDASWLQIRPWNPKQGPGGGCPLLFRLRLAPVWLGRFG